MADSDQKYPQKSLKGSEPRSWVARLSLSKGIEWMWQRIAEKVFLRFEFILPKEEIRKWDERGKVIFVLNRGGLFEFLFLSSWCHKNGMGGIVIVNRRRLLLVAKLRYFFQILFHARTYGELFSSAETSPRVLILRGRERKKAFKPTPSEKLLSELVEVETNTGRRQPYWIVPVLVLWKKHVRGEGRRPSEFLLGSSSRPNVLGKFWFLLRRRVDSQVKALPGFHLFEENGETSQGLSLESEAMRRAKVARRRALVELHKEMRVALGPRYAPPAQVKDVILHDPEVQAHIKEEAVRLHVNPKKVMSTAYHALTEIAADYRFRFIEILYFLLSWLFRKVSDGLDTKEDDLFAVRELNKTKPIVYISCHRSHFDYLVIPYVLYLRDMVTPHIAAGVNLSFWPLGPFLRKAGAFFIRRSFRGDRLYSLLVKKYIGHLLHHRFSQMFFIEGTRSRSGKMLPPQYGLLKMAFDSLLAKACDDIVLTPVSLCYDEVPEQSSYSRELLGEQKVKENAGALIQSRKVFKRNIGKVYVRFAEPLLAKELLNQGAEAKVDPTLTLQKTAFQICKSINDVTPITTKSILCTVLLCGPKEGSSLQKVFQLCSGLAGYAHAQGRELGSWPLDNFTKSVEHNIHSMLNSQFIQKSTNNDLLSITDSARRILLNFYKNNSIHCFVVPSILWIALGQLIKKSQDSHFSWSDLSGELLELRNLLKFEFFFSPSQMFLKENELALRYFTPEMPTTSISRDWISKIVREEPLIPLFQSVVGELVESYSTVLSFLEMSSDQEWEKKTLIQNISKWTGEKRAREALQFPESNSIQNYTNAIACFENKKVLSLRKDQDKTWVQVLANSQELAKELSLLEGVLGNLR